MLLIYFLIVILHSNYFKSHNTAKTMESWVGRDRGDSTEIARKTVTSHVARMTGGKINLVRLLNCQENT